MFFGLTIEKVLVIGLIAALVIGPERLPRYAEGLARATARAREFLRGARSRVQEEVGDDVDWRKLDPRQYDPRRIIREALLDDAPVPTVSAAAMAAAATPGLQADTQARSRERAEGLPTPFDSEAT